MWPAFFLSKPAFQNGEIMKALYHISILVIATAFTISCQKKIVSDGADSPDFMPLKAEILISDVSTDKCLNLEKLMTQLQNPQFAFPAATMSSDLKSITTLSNSKTNYFSFSTFYYKQGKANELALFNQVKQADCSTIQILSASREVLTFKIVENSELHIKFQLEDKWRDSMAKMHKQASFDRIQPYEYTVIYASKNNLKIIQKYKTVDPLCESKKGLKMELTKNITWAQTEAELPSRYEINSAYYNNVKESVLADVAVGLPELDGAGTLAVSEIQSVMNLPIRNELKYCN